MMWPVVLYSVVTIFMQELSLAGLFNVLSTKPVLNKVSTLYIFSDTAADYSGIILVANNLYCTDAGG